MNSKLRVGVVGLGSICTEHHLPHWKSCPYTQLVAVCDNNPERVREIASKYPGVETHESWQDLVNRADLDIVDIATPNELHAPIAIMALELAKHVFCEKPMATCSGIAFSGAEDVVLIDLAHKTGLPFSVFVLDTGRLHPETLAFIDVVRQRYGIEIEVFFPRHEAVEALVRSKGTMSFMVDGHHECCGIRKVEPLARALAGRDAWMTGLRPDQSPATRAALPLVEEDARSSQHAGPGRRLFKVNPLARWDANKVWAWLREHEVPFNPLHLQGFRSIGCAPCTRPVHPGQHEREGRWWWEEATKRECGLHLK